MYEWIGKWTGNTGAGRLVFRIAAGLPGWIIMGLCLIMAWIMMYVLPHSSWHIRTRSNLGELLTGREPRQLRRIQLRYYENVLLTLYELLVASARLEETAAGRFLLQGEEHLQDALSGGKGAILYTPHLGNFFFYYWLLSRRYSCLTVATAGSRELRPLYLRFQAMGCEGIDYDSAAPLALMRRLRRHLQGGGVVLLLGDFYRPAFPLTRFLGHSTRLPDGAAALSIELGAPVVPFAGWRESGFCHRLTFEPPVHLAGRYSAASRSEATLLLNQHLERFIREHPESWFYWFNVHERWEEESGPPIIRPTEQGVDPNEAQQQGMESVPQIKWS